MICSLYFQIRTFGINLVMRSKKSDISHLAFCLRHVWPVRLVPDIMIKQSDATHFIMFSKMHGFHN